MVVYQDLKNLNYSITIKETSGDRKINNIKKARNLTFLPYMKRKS